MFTVKSIQLSCLRKSYLSLILSFTAKYLAGCYHALAFTNISVKRMKHRMRLEGFIPLNIFHCGERMFKAINNEVASSHHTSLFFSFAFLVNLSTKIRETTITLNINVKITLYEYLFVTFQCPQRLRRRFLWGKRGFFEA